MNSQITLSLRPEIIQKVEAAAQEHHISPIDYLVRFLEKVLAEPLPEESVSTQIERIAKTAPPLSEEEYEQKKWNYLTKKHGA